ncbi:molybdopterin molybdotransferase MoeA [soil metagenome]
MITVSEAKSIIAENVKSLSPVELPLSDAAGHTLAVDVISNLDIPPFPQSAMDGYAIIFDDKKEFFIRGEMAAGTSEQFTIQNGEAARIFTGAPLPAGADTVVMQEKVTVDEGKIFINDEKLSQGNNVRNKGAEIQEGTLAMSGNSYLSPAAVGFLASIGVEKVSVFPFPSVSIIVTGNELQIPGEKLAYGKVYESNSFSLRAALQKAGVKEINILQAIDNLRVLSDKLEEALQKSDVVLLTGGVSVGDYDFVIEASKACGVQQLFHKIKQRPGKPLFFGMKQDKLVFGLPGNPSSVLNCYYNYVLPSLEILSRRKNSVQIISARLTNNYIKKAGLPHFLKGHFPDGSVTVLSGQESFQLSSFAQANCLIRLEEEGTNYVANEMVEVLLLPL